MRWLAALLILALGGCVTLKPHSPEPSPKSINTRQWYELAGRLKPAPAKLGEAIHREAQRRLATDDKALPALTVLADTPETSLADLLLHGTEPLLQADEAFVQRLALVEASQAHPQAAFAQALTGFLLHPDFPCRHPLFQSYFEARYHTAPTSCPEPLPFLVVSRTEGMAPVWIEPSRLRAIHLLFAGHGEAMASRFGHVALRLVICPESDSAPETCDSNLYGHLTLGFMAHIDEFELNTIKALSGQYKAHLFAFPFMEAYRGYAIEEFRELFSLPLTLDAEESQRLLRQLAEIHWRYQGDYNFFSHNCATLLQQTLRALLPGFARQPVLARDYLRPDSFFTAIRSTPLVESARLASLEQAEVEGHYFPSTKNFYDQALNLVRDSMTAPSFTDIDGYLARPPGKRRAEIFTDQPFLNRLSRDSHLLEAQQLVEELAILRGERWLLALGSRYLRDFGDTLHNTTALAGLAPDDRAFFEQCFLQPIRQVTDTLPRLQAIPPRGSNLPLAPRPAMCGEDSAPARLNTLLHEVNHHGHEQWQQILAASHILNETVTTILVLKELTP